MLFRSNRVKVILYAAFFVLTAFQLPGNAFAYPPFLAKARKFGAKDCTFCHVHPEGGEPWNERGAWLLKEKENRKAENIDVEWLLEFKPGKPEPVKPETVKPAGEANSATQAADSKDSVAGEFLKREREWIELAKGKDRSPLDRILAADFIATDDNGRVSTRSEYVAEFSKFALESYRVDEFQARDYGDAAVVSARWWVKGAADGNQFTTEFRETDFWVKRNGQWQVAASHWSKLEKK